MGKNKILVLSTQSGDWEGLFINNILISEGHALGEGNSKKFWIKMSKEYDFGIEDIVEKELVDEDEETISIYGSFPKNVQELTGKYSQENETI